jgi:hypothetical protein
LRSRSPRRGRACAAATAVLFASIAIPAAAQATLVFDPFDDGDRTNGADPLDIAWFVTNTGNPTSAAVGDAGTAPLSSALLVTNTGGTFAPVVGHFSLLSLAVNQTATLTFDFRIGAIPSGGLPSAATADLRFGLYNSRGTQQTADTNSNASVTTDFGYRADIPVGTSTTGDTFQVQQESGTNGTVMAGSDNTLLGATAANVARIADQNVYSARLTLLRTGSGIDLTAAVFSGAGAAGAPLYSVTTTDTGAPNNNPADNSGIVTDFDTIAFGSANATFSYQIDNVRLSTAVVPEPGTLPLAVAASLPLLAARVRRRRRAGHG